MLEKDKLVADADDLESIAESKSAEAASVDRIIDDIQNGVRVTQSQSRAKRKVNAPIIDESTIYQDGDIYGADLGRMEIWDGADLALLRETFIYLYYNKGARTLEVNMGSVKYVPSGFFGLLYDWLEQDVSIRLFDPQQPIQEMIWFRTFFSPLHDGTYVMHRSEK